jgi:hypothetical protein
MIAYGAFGETAIATADGFRSVCNIPREIAVVQ